MAGYPVGIERGLIHLRARYPAVAGWTQPPIVTVGSEVGVDGVVGVDDEELDDEELEVELLVDVVGVLATVTVDWVDVVDEAVVDVDNGPDVGVDVVDDAVVGLGLGLGLVGGGDVGCTVGAAVVGAWARVGCGRAALVARPVVSGSVVSVVAAVVDVLWRNPPVPAPADAAADPSSVLGAAGSGSVVDAAMSSPPPSSPEPRRTAHPITPIDSAATRTSPLVNH